MELDAELTPARLREPDDFTALRIVAHRPAHLWISRAELVRLAGPRAQDETWRADFDRMLAYAESKGWTNEEGAIRAHVEWR